MSTCDFSTSAEPVPCRCAAPVPKNVLAGVQGPPELALFNIRAAGRDRIFGRNHFTFLGGAVLEFAPLQLQALLREADLYALPTRADSHAIASLEAMAMELPVITTPVGGVPDVVEEGVTGYLVPKDDPSALADRIRALRDDRSLRLRMGAAGRKRVAASFDARTVAATVIDVLKRAAASRSQAP